MTHKQIRFTIIKKEKYVYIKNKKIEIIKSEIDTLKNLRNNNNYILIKDGKWDSIKILVESNELNDFCYKIIEFLKEDLPQHTKSVGGVRFRLSKMIKIKFYDAIWKILFISLYTGYKKKYSYVFQ